MMLNKLSHVSGLTWIETQNLQWTHLTKHHLFTSNTWSRQHKWNSCFFMFCTKFCITEQRLFQQFIVCNYHMQSLALLQNIFKFCTFMFKFSNILPFFNIPLPFFWKIAPMPLLSRIDNTEIVKWDFFGIAIMEKKVAFCNHDMLNLNLEVVLDGFRSL